MATITGSSLVCQRIIDDQQIIFYDSGNCLPENSNDQYHQVCETRGNSITFTYTIKPSLRNDVSYEVACVFADSGGVSALITITVQGTRKIVVVLMYLFFQF